MAAASRAGLRRYGVLVVAGLLALALGIGGALWLRSPGGAGQDATPLLSIALPDTEGRSQALSQWRGKVLVVNFWATWCAPCREEMPLFMKAQDEYGARGLQFVGIAVDDQGKVKQFASELGLNYPALIGGYGAMELSKTLGNAVAALPFTVVVDREGRIRHTHLGPVKPGQLEKIVQPYL